MRSCAIVVSIAVADDDVEFFPARAAFVGSEFHLENLLVLDVSIIRRNRRNVNSLEKIENVFFALHTFSANSSQGGTEQNPKDG